jgi:hypothetical protein
MPMGIAPMQGANMGALISAAAGSPIEQLMKGIMAGTQVYSQMQQQGQEQRLQRQEVQQRQQEMQLQMAGAQSDQVKAALRANPKFASSNLYIQAARNTNRQLGLPDPVGADGKLAPSYWQTPWTEAPSADHDRFYAAAPGSDIRKGFASQYSGVTDEMMNEAPALTAKEQAGLKTAYASGLRAENYGTWLQQRQAYDNAVLHMRQGLATAQEANLLQEAQRNRADAAAIPARLGLEEQRVGLEAARLQLEVKRFDASPGISGQRGVQAAASRVLGLNDWYSTHIDSLNEKIQSLSASSDNPDQDPIINALKQQVKTYTVKQGQLSQLTDRATQIEAEQLGVKGDVHAASGKTVTNVQNVGQPKTKSAPPDMRSGTVEYYKSLDPAARKAYVNNPNVPADVRSYLNTLP